MWRFSDSYYECNNKASKKQELTQEVQNQNSTNSTLSVKEIESIFLKLLYGKPQAYTHSLVNSTNHVRKKQDPSYINFSTEYNEGKTSLVVL